MYYICRRERDAQIFQSIKEWELEHFRSDQLPSKGEDQSPSSSQATRQEGYLEDLKGKRQEIVQRFESTPSSIANKHKRWRMAADIEQLQWRHQYLLDSRE
jgi:hypothetical protein